MAIDYQGQDEPRVPLANLYYLLCYAHNRLEARDLVDVSTLEGNAPVHLYAVVLDEGMRRLRQRGVPRLYRTITEDTRAPRGRIELTPSLSLGLLMRGKVRCSVDILTEDVAFGRILKAALRRLAGNRDIAEERRHRLRDHVRFLGQVSDVQPTPALLADAYAMRLDGVSRFVLHICAMVLEDVLIEPGKGPASFRSWAGTPPKMGHLFENFVANFLRREQTCFEVKKPPIPWRVEASPAHHDMLPRMEGDILLVHGTQRILLEAKFAARTLSDSGTRLKTEHLYQLHTYLSHLAGGMSPLTGVLLYAQVEGPLRFDYTLAGFRLLVRSLDLAQPWQGIHHDLLALVEDVAAVVPEARPAAAKSGA